jgi:hypothetical protein
MSRTVGTVNCEPDMMGVFRWYMLQVHPYLKKGTIKQRDSAKRISKALSQADGLQYHLTVEEINGRKSIIFSRYKTRT